MIVEQPDPEVEKKRGYRGAHVEQSARDSAGVPASLVDLRGNVITQTDALGHAVHFYYDADDNLTRAEGLDGSVATYDYDGINKMPTACSRTRQPKRHRLPARPSCPRRFSDYAKNDRHWQSTNSGCFGLNPLQKME
jgi:YD repeat-containing protein